MNKAKMKIVVFGVGRLLNEYIREMNIDEIVGFIDNDSSKLYQTIYGRTVVQPSRIMEFTFDYVVIFNQKNRKKMHDQLIELGVDGSKIIGWQYYLYVFGRGVTAFSRLTFSNISNIARGLAVNTALDVEKGIKRNGFYITGTDIRNCFSYIDSLNFDEKINSNIYRKSINNINEIDFYDIIIFLDYFMEHTVEELQELIKETYDRSKYILLTLPYAYPAEWTEWSEINFSQYGTVMEIPGRLVRLIIIKKELSKEYGKHAAIYVVSHKKFEMPADKLLVPVYVKDVQTPDQDARKAFEGDHIGELNLKINELTALYWIWKNTYTDIVGICHYRRYFSVMPNVFSADFALPDQDRIEEELEACDMIVTSAVCSYPFSLKEQLRKTVFTEAFEMGMKLVRERIEEVCPEYMEDFEECFQGFIMYPCNMFITSWDIFSNYCEWLFGIVIDVARYIDVTLYDSYSQRIIGFIAERLLTVWIRHNNIKIKEYPVMLVG